MPKRTRFRRRWLAAKEKVRTGQLGDAILVTSRAFMNRLVALDNYKGTTIQRGSRRWSLPWKMKNAEPVDTERGHRIPAHKLAGFC